MSDSDLNLVPWPPEADLPRLRAYHEYYEWYRNEPGGFDAPIPLLRSVSHLIAGRMMSEGVQWSPPSGDEYGATAELLKSVYDQCNLTRLLMAAATGCSYRGDAVLKVRYDADRLRIVVNRVHPSKYYPETHPLDAEQVTAAAIAQVLHDGDKVFLWHERHDPGRITNLLWRLREDTDAFGQTTSRLVYDPVKDRMQLTACQATAELPEEQETGVDAILVVHIANAPTDESGLWGVSDYEAIGGIQGTINEREQERGEILAKHSDPILQGPDLSGVDGIVDLKANKYLVIPEGGLDGSAPMASYITWDGQLAANQEDIRYLTEALATGAGVDVAALVSMLENGSPASGRAIRLLQNRTTTTVNTRALAWAEALSHVASLISKLALAPGVKLKWQPSAGTVLTLEPDDVTVTFADGLPSDPIEETQVQSERLAAKVQSRMRAIMALDGLSEEDAAARVTEIDKEAMAGEHVDAASNTFGGMAPTAGFFGVSQPAAQSGEQGQQQEQSTGQQAPSGPITQAP